MVDLDCIKSLAPHHLVLRKIGSQYSAQQPYLNSVYSHSVMLRFHSVGNELFIISRVSLRKYWSKALEILEQYSTAILIIGLTGLILFLQLLVNDVTAIKAKHTPGYPIDPDHDSFHFRVARAIANTNESVAIFILFVAFGLLTLADPVWLNRWAVVYFAGRVAHMLCYYFGIKLARSVSFAISLVGLVGLFVIALQAWA